MKSVKLLSITSLFLSVINCAFADDNGPVQVSMFVPSHISQETLKLPSASIVGSPLVSVPYNIKGYIVAQSKALTVNLKFINNAAVNQYVQSNFCGLSLPMDAKFGTWLATSPYTHPGEESYHDRTDSFQITTQVNFIRVKLVDSNGKDFDFYAGCAK